MGILKGSLLLVLKTEALMSKHACLGSLLLDLEDRMSSWTENYFYSLTCNNTHINRSHRLAPFTWHTPVLSPETEPCTWVRLACLCSVRDNSRFTRAKSHTARMHTAARSRCWEIPSKNSTLAVLCEHIPEFFITSHSWNESQTCSYGAVLKIQFTLKLAINLPRPRILHVSSYPC